MNDDAGVTERRAAWIALMTRAQQGDQAAYAQILREMMPFIRSLVRHMHWDEATIEDVVQDTLLTIHRVRDTYEPGRSAHAWVAAIARRRAIDVLRSQRRQRAKVEPLGDQERADDRVGVAEAYAHKAELARALEMLPASQREAFWLLKVEEHSLEEAAEISGRTVIALKSLVFRAVKTLRTHLTGVDDG